MRTIKILLTLLVAAAILVPVAARAAEDVDLLLVLAADVSRSIDATKFQLQREGYAAAVADPRVLDAIRSGRNGRIGVDLRRVVRRRRAEGRDRLDARSATPDSAKGFGDRLLEAPRSFADRTSISGAHRIRHGAARHSALSRRRATPSTSPATAPTMPAATSPRCATRPWPKASPSTALSSSATTRCRGIPTTPIRRAVSTIIIATTSSAVRRLRHGGEKLQLVRPGHHQQNDRRGGAGTSSPGRFALLPAKRGPAPRQRQAIWRCGHFLF